MPIRPEMWTCYPGGSPRSQRWHQLRVRVLAEYHGCCAHCSAGNGTLIERDNDPAAPAYRVVATGELYCADTGAFLGRASLADLTEPTRVRVQLQLAHRDGNPRSEDVMPLCQRCHNIFDRKQRAQTRRQTEHGQRALADLFDVLNVPG